VATGQLSGTPTPESCDTNSAPSPWAAILCVEAVGCRHGGWLPVHLMGRGWVWCWDTASAEAAARCQLVSVPREEPDWTT